MEQDRMPRNKPMQLALVVKNPPANAGDLRDRGSVPGWENYLEEDIATDSSILA